MIYLDYSATTPVNENVLATYCKVCKEYIGNSNSLHKLGTESNKIIAASTEQIAKILKVKPIEIIYTSGASEANNTAIKGICYKYKNRAHHILTTKLEHSSVIEPIKFLEKQGFTVDFINLDEHGLVDLNDLKAKIKEDTILVSINAINSEVGIRQPIEEIGKILKEYPKVYFHSDITQAIGKEDIDLTNVDLASFSAQKIYGMKGIGVLIKKENIVIEPLIHGGKSTTIYRSGTPATALIVSLAKAIRLVEESKKENQQYVCNIHDYLLEKLKKLNLLINSNEYCIPHIINISIPNIKAETILHALEQEEIYISTQTACSITTYSQPVYALTKDKTRASHSLRISISHLTTKDEIDIFIKTLKNCIEKLTLK